MIKTESPVTHQLRLHTEVNDSLLMMTCDVLGSFTFLKGNGVSLTVFIDHDQSDIKILSTLLYWLYINY